MVGWWDATPAVQIVDDVTGTGGSSKIVFASSYLRTSKSDAGELSSNGGVLAVASWDDKQTQKVRSVQ